MTKKAKADCYSNLFDEVKTAAAYWRLLKKDIRNNKSKQTNPPIKENDGTLTTDDTEKTTMLNDYFRIVTEKLIDSADENSAITCS